MLAPTADDRLTVSVHHEGRGPFRFLVDTGADRTAVSRQLAERLGLAPGRNPLEVELGLLERVPAKYLPDAHHWLILHGRYVCLARAPRCTVCALQRWCDLGRRIVTPTIPEAHATRAVARAEGAADGEQAR